MLNVRDSKPRVRGGGNLASAPGSKPVELLDFQLICCNCLVIFIRNFNQIDTIAKIVIANCFHFDEEKVADLMAQMSIKDRSPVVQYSLG